MQREFKCGVVSTFRYSDIKSHRTKINQYLTPENRKSFFFSFLKGDLKPGTDMSETFKFMDQ